MQREIHLVGSIGLSSAEEVFRAVSGLIGNRVARIPDGETGARSSWIHWNRVVFEANPALEPDPSEMASGGRITTAVEGTRRWGGGPARAIGSRQPPRLCIKDGVTLADMTFAPLGHVAEAQNSYAIFRRLRDEGVIAPGTRFQVSLPTVGAALNAHIIPAQQALVETPLMRRLFADVADLCATIPHPDLAIQWDVSHEMALWEGVRPAWFDDVQEGISDRLAAHLEQVPTDVPAGLHLCYGSYGDRHWKEPEDLGNCVAVYSKVANKTTRPISWVHMPVPVARDDEAYFTPLSDLVLDPETTLYLGLIHISDGIE
ncbi:MAG: hypothetical protein GEU92_20035, partial [Alphaproteobacteria bacterium]|nr:hypothetical protein [Alphaproteobacteria bacterium]